jgi:hypothetical protein
MTCAAALPPPQLPQLPRRLTDVLLALLRHGADANTVNVRVERAALAGSQATQDALALAVDVKNGAAKLEAEESVSNEPSGEDIADAGSAGDAFGAMDAAVVDAPAAHAAADDGTAEQRETVEEPVASGAEEGEAGGAEPGQADVTQVEALTGSDANVGAAEGLDDIGAPQQVPADEAAAGTDVAEDTIGLEVEQQAGQLGEGADTTSGKSEGVSPEPAGETEQGTAAEETEPPASVEAIDMEVADVSLDSRVSGVPVGCFKAAA